MSHPGVLLNVAALIVAYAWLAFFSIDLPRPSQFLLRVNVAASLLALALIPVSWIPPERLPTALLVLMPGRFLNFSAMTFAVMLIGLSGSRRELWARVVLLFVTFGLLATDHSMLWEFLEHHHDIHYQSAVRPLPLMWIGAAAMIAGALWTRRHHGRHGPSRRSASGAEADGHYVLHGMYIAEVALLVLVVLMTLHQSLPQSGAHFLDRTNDVFYADVASHSGILLLAGDLRLIQLRTRRPVLVDSGALDTVMYSLETGADMQRIMRDVYGLDMFHPPPDAVGSGRIPPLAHRRIWESYSPETWRRIRHEFGVTQVLAYADWSLQLPVAAQSRRLLLYDIPER